MIAQVVLPPEGLVADVTRVRPLVRVGPLVDEQVVGFGKVSAAKLADELFFRFRGQPPPGGLSVRSQFAEARDGAAQPRAQLAQLAHLWGVLLRGGHGQVGKVKTGPVLVQGREDVGDGSLLGVEEVRGEGQGLEGEARVHEALRRRHLGEGGAGDLVHVGVAQRPVVHVHGLHGAEPVQALQVVHGGGEGVHGLQEGVVGELQRRVERDGRRQGLAPHFPGFRGAQGAAPFFQDSEARWVWGSRENPERDDSRDTLEMTGRERQSRDCYPNQLGLNFGAGASHHTFLVSPPHPPPAPQGGGEGTLAPGQGVGRARNGPLWAGHPQRGRAPARMELETPGREKEKGGGPPTSPRLAKRSQPRPPSVPTPRRARPSPCRPGATRKAGLSVPPGPSPR